VKQCTRNSLMILGAVAILAALVYWFAGDSWRNAHVNGLLRQGQIDPARDVYQELATSRADTPVPVHNLGLCDDQQDNPERAAELLRKAVKQAEQPRRSGAKSVVHPNYYYHLGNALLAAGDKNGRQAATYQEALANYKKAVAAAPKDLDAKYNYELAKLRVKQAQEQPRPNQNNASAGSAADQNQDSSQSKSNQNPKPNQPPNGNQTQPGAKSTPGTNGGSPPGTMSKAEAEALLRLSENGAQYQGPVVHGTEPVTKDW
jgi:Ca-activated chloride channel family protein